MPPRVLPAAPVEANVVVDPALFALYMRLRQFELANRDIAVNLELPKLCICGEQSSGKSSLMQLYLGFPCALVRQGTGTRCPVSYVLQHNATCQRPRVLRPEGVSIQGLAAWMAEQMEEINREEPSHFRDDVLQVVVEHDGYLNLELVDLPGLVEARRGVPAGEFVAERVRVKELISAFVSDPAYIVVFLRRADDEVALDIGYPIIREMFESRPHNADSDHFVCIATKWQLLRPTPTINAHFDALLVEHPRIMYTEMWPPYMAPQLHYFDASRASFEAIYEYLRTVPEVEQAFVDSWAVTAFAADPTARERFDADTRPRVGVAVIMRELRNTWARLFTRLLHTVRRSLTDASIRARGRIDELRAQTAELSEEAMRARYQQYLADFVQTLDYYLHADARSRMSVDRFGRTWSEESSLDLGDCRPSDRDLLQLASRWPPQQNLGQLQASFTPQERQLSSVAAFLDDLQLKSCGDSAVRRVHQVCLFLILQFVPAPISKAHINQYLGHIVAAVAQQPFLFHTAKQLVWNALDACFQQAAEWLTSRYLALFNQFSKDVQEQLTRGAGAVYLSIATHDDFHSLVRLAFLETVQQQLSNARAVFHTLLDCRRDFLNLDATVRLMQQLAMVPRAMSFAYSENLLKGESVLQNGQAGRILQPAAPPMPMPGATINSVIARFPRPHACELLMTSNEVANVDSLLRQKGLLEVVKAVTDEMYCTAMMRLADDLQQVFNSIVFLKLRDAPPAQNPLLGLKEQIQSWPADRIRLLSLSSQNAELLRLAREETVLLQTRIDNIAVCIAAVDDFLRPAGPVMA